MKFMTLGLLGLVQVIYGSPINLKVTDDQGLPLKEATTTIWFRFPNQTQGEPWIGISDSSGQVAVDRDIQFGFSMRNSKDGFYEAYFQHVPPKDTVRKTIILPRIINPVPLYARRCGYVSEATVVIPLFHEWIGYDFEAGDWVQPNGKGKTTDIRFRFRNEFRGYDDGIKNLDEEISFSKRAFAARREEWTEEKFKLRAGKWDGELEISFPGESEGMVEEKDHFLSYSQLKLPHEAPVEGYQPTWHYATNSYSPTTLRDDVGFFLRTRVKLDEKGNILSANYAKVIGDFHFSPANGAMQFLYYFNPVPNDRNLEFDPKRNLFPAGFPGANVSDP